MNVTNYLELNKPQDADQFDVSHFNQNADAIDTAIESSLENMAPVEPYQTATQAHAKGTYLVRNGYLYKTTDAIAVGENISQKTYRTDLNTELKTLRDSLGCVKEASTGNFLIFQYGVDNVGPFLRVKKGNAFVSLFRGEVY